MPKKWLENINGSPKELFIVTFLLVNALSCYFIGRRHIDVILGIYETTSTQNLMIFGIHDLGIIGSGIVGAWLSIKIKRLKILYLWIILGIISSFLIYILPYLPLLYIQIISFFFGASFGLGMPSCLAYFGELTTFEDRGYIGGLIFFVASAAASLLLMLLNISFKISILTSVVWRIIGFMVLLLLKPVKMPAPDLKQTSFKLIFGNRQFFLYLIPWFMFSCIYGFQKVTLEHAIEADFYDILRVIESSFGAISAVLSGIFCGRFGRKIVVIYGFVSLGIAYAVVSIASASIISLYFYSMIDGIAWGMFIVMFVLVLWGDLSSTDTRFGEKYYAIGSIPFFFADLVSFVLAPYLRFPISAAFSIASFFLFLAVIPLIFASETLPEKKIRERELKKYIEKAKKIKEKYVKE